MPTPMETVIIRLMLGMDGTSLASTCKSGSAIVIISPIIKVIKIIIKSFELFVR